MNYKDSKTYKEIEKESTALGWNIRYLRVKNRTVVLRPGEQINTPDNHHIEIDTNKKRKDDDAPIVDKFQFLNEKALRQAWDRAKAKLEGSIKINA